MIGISLTIVSAISFLDYTFPGRQIAEITAWVISIAAAFLALYQYREEAKISSEISRLDEDANIKTLTKIQREAVLRNRRRRKHDLENRRLLIIVGVIVVIACAESLSLVSSLLETSQK
ncbi:MAG: hypothetical protein AAGB02_07665 [Pseudomonadota bacterium]